MPKLEQVTKIGRFSCVN